MLDSALFWFRRDLRCVDNAGLSAALASAKRVFCVFVFDREILDQLPSKRDRRVEFIWHSVAELKAALQKLGGDLIVRHATARDEIPALAETLEVDAVFTNDDYEPAARMRDEKVGAKLKKHGTDFRTFKDTVIFEKSEVLTQAGGTFSVFTPYKNAWLKKVTDETFDPHEIAPYKKHFAKLSDVPNAAPMLEFQVPSLEEMGFKATNITKFVKPGMSGAAKLRDDFIERMEDYKIARDFPGVRGVSYLSVHNRFGTISIRELVRIAYAETLRRKNIGAETWLAELIWRDFYFQIIWHHPHAATSAFRPEYDALKWQNDKKLFAAWYEARTGYPIIDAAMRQINDTGYMHNRLRMIVASFLTKDLLIDWRWGEKYFADNLNDFDLSANNGGWQWAASTGCDAQPYFRIFNPVTQSERFDPEGKFIRKYLPELANVPAKFIHAPWMLPPLEQQARGVTIGRDYPAPIVDHAVQRDKALALFKAVKDA
jgi:deoxyribodipyrimidine photo-lyase